MTAEKPALVLLDVQNGVVDRLENTEPYLQAVASVTQAVRNVQVDIIHVVTGFRAGYPECHPRNSSMSKVKAWGAFRNNHQSAQVHPAVSSSEEEPIVTKHRVSAFTSTDLDLILRSMGITEVVIAGLITSGAVLSTVRSAADLDYNVTVVEDLCMDRDPELHQVLMNKVFSRQGRVISSEVWLKEIGQ
ncbi:isochorismatase family protein [Aspergillus sclerotioniger CBS 115572]|uniref:Isochorismatase family protein n=1 Tax=Aspergillus sclerotioniger CBS 115572 TaxID=1450535 RepID=A0A317W613_9EURO|nr:isochorismatase family protein [Aspergillus sclerotioniger CBS 115572]PWY81529.1 isochorismatase family protein [Aspergillus sclerotioniger CBS 115572]